MPTIISHQVIDGCDVRCRFCNLWAKGLNPRTPMTLKEIEAMLDEGARLGFNTYNIYGGEPLTRDDIGEVLAAAKERGFHTVMCSNSRQLLERVDQIAPYIDVYLCSIDGAPRTHDLMRNDPGLFEKVLEGIRVLKEKSDCNVWIWTHLHRHNASQVVAIAELAEKLGASVDFYPTHSAARGAGSLVLDEEERRKVFDTVLEAKRRGLPIRTEDETILSARDNTPFRCMWPTEAVYVAPDGEVFPCEQVYTDAAHRLGNVREDGLARIIGSPEFAQYARELEACNACRLPCVMRKSKPC